VLVKLDFSNAFNSLHCSVLISSNLLPIVLHICFPTAIQPHGRCNVHVFGRPGRCRTNSLTNNWNKYFYVYIVSTFLNVKWTPIVLSPWPLSFSVSYRLLYSWLTWAALRTVREACLPLDPKPARCEFHGRLSLFVVYSRPQAPLLSLHIRSDSFTAWRRASSLQTLFAYHMQCINGIFLMHCVHCNL